MINSMARSLVTAKKWYRNMLAGNASAVPAYELISTTVLANSTTGTVSLTSIPQGYKHLQLRMTLRTTDTYSAGTYGAIAFNGTSSTYNTHTMWGDGSSIQSSYSTGGLYYERISTNYDATGNFGAVIIDILDYNNTNKYKTTRQLGGYHGAGARQINYKSGLWQSTSAISEIAVTTPVPSSLYFVAGSRISLYGIKG